MTSNQVVTFTSMLTSNSSSLHLIVPELISWSLPRYLKTPLETLSITVCKLSQLDLNSLSQSQSLHQLKHLNLRLVKLIDLYPTPFCDLLNSVAGTLQTLELEGCWMVDSQLITLLPALSQCSQLTRVNFYDNDISMAVLKDLLYHTANLNQLIQELYPAPLECYDDRGDVRVGRFAQLCPELMDTLITVRQPKRVSFATHMCHKCCQRCIYDLETRLCHCWR